MGINCNYEVIISDSAKADLEEIYSNIAKNTAKNLMKKIEENILRLEQFPYSCLEIKVKPHKEVFRKLVINNYIVLYEVDEDYKQVIIYNIIYSNTDYLI